MIRVLRKCTIVGCLEQSNRCFPFFFEKWNFLKLYIWLNLKTLSIKKQNSYKWNEILNWDGSERKRWNAETKSEILTRKDKGSFSIINHPLICFTPSWDVGKDKNEIKEINKKKRKKKIENMPGRAWEFIEFATSGEDDQSNFSITQNGELISLFKKSISSFCECNLSIYFVLYLLQLYSSPSHSFLSSFLPSLYLPL